MLFDMPHTLFYYNYSTEPLFGSAVTIIPPVGVPGSLNTFANPWAYYSTGANIFPTVQNATSPYPTAAYYESVPLHVHNTYVDQWNLAIQKQVGSSWLFKASYLGNDVIHLWTDQEGNPAVYLTNGMFGITVNPPVAPSVNNSCRLFTGVKLGVPVYTTYSPCNSTSSTQARRLLTLTDPLRGTVGAQGIYYGTVELLDDGGTASYNGLILSAEHRLTQHFSMLANYTWSHCIADAQTTELSGPIYTNPANRRFDRGNCSYVDVHHNFNLSGVLQSPHFSSSALQWIAGNWQLAPIVGIHSGSYFTVTTGVDNALNGIPAQRPNVVSDPYCLPKSVSPILANNCWLNKSSFAPPANGTFGNERVNSLQGPGYIDFDLSISRRFPFKESQSFEIRFEAFNVANHPNFLNPGTAGIAGGTAGTALNSSTFGKIQSDVGPRIMQFAFKYAF
jgi:hypothetical protein